MINFLLTNLINFESVTFTTMLKSYSRQNLYMNLMKTVQMMPCTCMQRMNHYEKEWYCSRWFTWWALTTEAGDKIPDNCKYPLTTIQAAQNQKQTNTGGLAKLLKLRIGPKVMLTNNLDIDCLINGQSGNINHIELAQGSIQKVYIKFFWLRSWLKSNKIILSRHTKFFGSYWKMGNRDSNKERLSITIH